MTAAQREHDLWLTLCRQLQTMGAVTGADLEAPIGRRKTPGEKLLTLVRRWGNAHAALLDEELREP